MSAKKLTMPVNRSSCLSKFEERGWGYSHAFKLLGVSVGIQATSAQYLERLLALLPTKLAVHQASEVEILYSLEAKGQNMLGYYSWTELAQGSLESVTQEIFNHLQLMLCWKTTRLFGLPGGLVRNGKEILCCLGPDLPREALEQVGEVVLAPYFGLPLDGNGARSLLRPNPRWQISKVCYWPASDSPKSLALYLSELVRNYRLFREQHGVLLNMIGRLAYEHPLQRMSLNLVEN